MRGNISSAEKKILVRTTRRDILVWRFTCSYRRQVAVRFFQIPVYRCMLVAGDALQLRDALINLKCGLNVRSSSSLVGFKIF
jgi:hypothetical protein